jgi:magnesium chelatase family protein
MNPCPCGYFLDIQKVCGRALAVVTKYQKLISGASLDRIDIQIEVRRKNNETQSGDRMRRQVTIRALMQAAPDIQQGVLFRYLFKYCL